MTKQRLTSTPCRDANELMLEEAMKASLLEAEQANEAQPRTPSAAGGPSGGRVSAREGRPGSTGQTYSPPKI